jgi:hypothetical protein
MERLLDGLESEPSRKMPCYPVTNLVIH